MIPAIHVRPSNPGTSSHIAAARRRVYYGCCRLRRGSSNAEADRDKAGHLQAWRRRSVWVASEPAGFVTQDNKQLVLTSLLQFATLISRCVAQILLQQLHNASIRSLYDACQHVVIMVIISINGTNLTRYQVCGIQDCSAVSLCHVTASNEASLTPLQASRRSLHVHLYSHLRRCW